MTSTVPASTGGPLSETDRLAEIQARLDAATPGPWHRKGKAVLGPREERDLGTGPAALLHTGMPYDGPDGRCGANAELAANAPADLEFLLNLVGVLEGQLATAQAELARLEPMRCEVCGRRVAHVNAYGHLIGWGCADGNECTDHNPSWADVREAVRAAGYRLRRRGPVEGDPALSRWSKTVRWDLESVTDAAETRGGFNLIHSWWHSEGGDEDPYVSVEIDLDDGSGTEIHLWSASPAQAWGAAVAACAIEPAKRLGLDGGGSDER